MRIFWVVVAIIFLSITAFAIGVVSDAKLITTSPAIHEPIEMVCSNISSFFELFRCTILKITGANELQLSEHDLLAQQSMAYWAKVMTIAAIIQAAFSIVGIGLIWGTFKQTAESVEIARKSYVAEHRPLLKIYPTKVGPMSFTTDSIGLSCTLQVENCGTHPATNVIIGYTFYRGRGLVVGKSGVESMVLEERKTIDDKVQDGFTMLPGEKSQMSTYTSAKLDPTTEEWADHMEFLGKSLGLTFSLACCVFYKGLASSEWYYAANSFSIDRKDDKMIEIVAGSIPAEKLSCRMVRDSSQMT